jgi:hypothetical protein
MERKRDGVPHVRDCENRKRTADLSTTLRSGRDDNSVAAKIVFFSWESGILSSNRIVISTGA